MPFIIAVKQEKPRDCGVKKCQETHAVSRNETAVSEMQPTVTRNAVQQKCQMHVLVLLGEW